MTLHDGSTSSNETVDEPPSVRLRALRAARRAFGRARELRERAFREPVVSVGFTLVAAGAFIYGICVVAMQLWYESLGPYNVDTSIYWAVGRGIANGLVPYRDLYETKPPGIFLLSALSYVLRGDYRLTHATQIVSLATIALSPAAFVPRIWKIPRGKRLHALPLFIALWALVLEATAFVAHYADAVQTEAHAMPGMVAYMLLVGVRKRWAFFGRLAGILVAIGMKEPFVLSVVAAYMILDPSFRDPWSDLFGPLLGALLIGSALLLLAGWFQPYVGIYLAMMTRGHVTAEGSPWARALPSVDRTWNMLAEHSPLFPLTLLLVAAVYVLAPPRTASFIRVRPVARRLQILFAATLLAGLAVGMGGHFYGHHFVFATPVHLALLYASISLLARTSFRDAWVRSGLIGLVVTSVYLQPWTTAKAFMARADEVYAEDWKARASARVIDNVLDRLDVDRYLWLGHPGFAPLPFTKHLPIGPLFFQQEMFFKGRFGWLRREFRRSLDRAEVIVFFMHMTGSYQKRVKKTLEEDYEPVPPEWQPSSFPYQIFVRKGVLDRH